MPQLDDKPWLIVLLAGIVGLAGGGGGAAVTTLSDARMMGQVIADIEHLQTEQTQVRKQMAALVDRVADLAASCVTEDALLNQDKAHRQLMLTQRIGSDNSDSRQWEQLRRVMVDMQGLRGRVEDIEGNFRRVDAVYDWIKTRGPTP